MAKATKTTTKVTKTIEVEEPTGVTLTLSMEEAKALRSLLGASSPDDNRNAGMRDIWEALHPVVGLGSGDFRIIRKGSY
jgi:hypothetical protein